MNQTIQSNRPDLTEILLNHLTCQNSDFLRGFVSAIHYSFPDSEVSLLVKIFSSYPIETDFKKFLINYYQKNGYLLDSIEKAGNLARTPSRQLPAIGEGVHS